VLAISVKILTHFIVQMIPFDLQINISFIFGLTVSTIGIIDCETEYYVILLLFVCETFECQAE
jgi:hypothetical protein